eukprot:COSAG06_NODE_60_length_27159_cov_57.986031_26_plen_107_part_00
MLLARVRRALVHLSGCRTGAVYADLDSQVLARDTLLHHPARCRSSPFVRPAQLNRAALRNRRAAAWQHLQFERFAPAIFGQPGGTENIQRVAQALLSVSNRTTRSV